MKTRYQKTSSSNTTAISYAAPATGLSEMSRFITSQADAQMKRPTLYTGVLITALALAACGSETSSTPKGALQANAGADQAIMEMVYTGPRTPDGFYQENLPDTFYSISHVKNTSLLAEKDSAGTPVYELSSGDFTEALEWSEAAAMKQPAYWHLVDTTETELYYQFTRVNPHTPDLTHYSRVFKSDALDRSGYDRNNPGNYQGTIALQAPTAEQVKQVIEYLWKFTISNNTGNAVTESYMTGTDSEFIHTMTEAHLTMGANGSCDTIKLFETQTTVQKTNGIMWSNEHQTRELSSRYEGGEYLLCEQTGE